MLHDCGFIERWYLLVVGLGSEHVGCAVYEPSEVEGEDISNNSHRKNSNAPGLVPAVPRDKGWN